MSSQPIALITGASRGIGAATAKALANRGYHLVLAARNGEALNEVAREVSQLNGGKSHVLCIQADVKAVEQCIGLVKSALDHFGQIDVLVNNAGIAPPPGLLQETAFDKLSDTIDINLKAPLYLMSLVIPGMAERGKGTIININSVAGQTAFPFWATYDASKFGLRAATEAVGEEQRSNGVRVCGIYPGAVDTEIWDTMDRANVNRDGMLNPEQIADAVCYVLDQPESVYLSSLTLMPTKPAL